MKKIFLVLSILEKDFTESVKNKTVLFAIIIPVLLSLVFSIVLRPKELSRLSLVIVDEGRSKIAEQLRVMGQVSDNLTIKDLKDLNRAKEAVRNGEGQAILVFPKNFDRDFEKGRNPKIDFWIGESGLQNALILKTQLNSILYYVRYKQLPPDFFQEKQLYGKDFSPRTAMLPTWILFTIIGGYMVVSSSIIEEKEKKTLSAILVTPCRLPEILIGKGLFGAALVVVGGILILALNQGFMGNIPALILIILLGAVFFSVTGVLAGLLLPSQTTSSTFGSLLFLLMFLPVAMAPASEKLRMVAKVLPSYYIQTGIMDAMFSGVSPAALKFHLGYLILVSAAIFIASIMVLKKKEDF